MQGRNGGPADGVFAVAMFLGRFDNISTFAALALSTQFWSVVEKPRQRGLRGLSRGDTTKMRRNLQGNSPGLQAIHAGSLAGPPLKFLYHPSSPTHQSSFKEHSHLGSLISDKRN